MAPPSQRLAVRDANDNTFSPLTQDLLFTLLVLVLISSCSALALFLMRRRRRAAKEAGLPFHNNCSSDPALSAGRSKHRRTPSSLTATVSTTTHSSFHSFFSRQEKQSSAAAKSSPSAHSLPEIRIHFPEEIDASGKHSTRVVSVRVGENGFGLEPVEESQPPPYQRDASDRFHSLDLARIGGLTEKDVAA